MSVCLTLVSYKWIRKTQVIPEYVMFYKNWGFYLEGSDFLNCGIKIW